MLNLRKKKIDLNRMQNIVDILFIIFRDIQLFMYMTCEFVPMYACLGNVDSTGVRRERSGSVVECLTRDRRAASSSLTGVTALWSLSKTIYPSLVLVQPRKTRPA